jgi:signal transduction histidine kinase
MKLGAKIFLCIMVCFSVIFLFGGYSLISFFYETAMEREIEIAVEQYQYNKFVMQATLITQGEDWMDGVVRGEYDIGSITSDMNETVAFFSTDGVELFSAFSDKVDFSTLFDGIEKEKVNYQFQKIGSRTHLLIAGMVMQENTGIYLVTGVDVEKILEQQELLIKKFEMIYAVAIVIGMLLIFGLSALLTGPIKRLTAATKKIADGNYQERILETGEDEVGQLAKNFNQMACAVEEKVQELSESARQKEDFVANFAHELKTPLTSVIGYANRIYQKELPREEQKQAALYIWNEGMRLEALALKLMDLTVLNHRNFTLQETEAGLLLHMLADDVKYFIEEKGASLSCMAEQAYIKVEYDLMKTLFLNLIDNSIKAGAKHISVTGNIEETKNAVSSGNETHELYYVIQVQDNGSGIPENEIKRITEAFYMVDKSRSRKFHSAGIGLALSQKIVELHGGNLGFESDGKTGTKVSIRIKCRGEDADE